MFAIIPLPVNLETARPEWVALVLIYWCMAIPERIGVGYGWIVGLLLDVLKGSLLGQHALALAVVAYITLKLYRRMRVFPLWQQSMVILFMLILHQLLILWFDGIVGNPEKNWLYWLASLTGMLLWPGVFLVLRGTRRFYKVR
jgi:rod shape-determining protein MreD